MAENRMYFILQAAAVVVAYKVYKNTSRNSRAKFGTGKVGATFLSKSKY